MTSVAFNGQAVFREPQGDNTQPRVITRSGHGNRDHVMNVAHYFPTKKLSGYNRRPEVFLSSSQHRERMPKNQATKLKEGLNLLGIAVVFMAAGPFTGNAACPVVFDALDSHEWIGEPWGADVSVTNVTFLGRQCLRADVTTTDGNWALLRTKRFPLENWESPITSLRADVHITGSKASTKLKLEVRGADFDTVIASASSPTLLTNQWQTVAWSLPTSADLSKVGAVSIVVDSILGFKPTIHIDELRLVTGGGQAILWDRMDGARLWFPFGNWFNWADVTGFPGLEPISSLDGSPPSPVASLLLEWDYSQNPDTNAITAEIGTNGSHDDVDRPGWLEADFVDVNRLGAWVRGSSTDVALRAFFYDADAGRGFATASSFLQSTDTWQQMVWDIPWPAGFDRADVDEIKLVVGDIDRAPQGSMRFDHLGLYTNQTATPISGLVAWLNDFNAQDRFLNQRGGAYGVVNSDRQATNVSLSFAYGQAHSSPAALQVDWNNLTNGFVGFWNSLNGRADYPEFTLDLSTWEYLQFFVRGSGVSTQRFNVKVELKEASPKGDVFYHTAYRYIGIDDANTNWSPVVLSLALDDPDHWSLNQFAPDRTRMKELVFVIENHFNPAGGTFFVDDLALVDTDSPPNPITPLSSDTAVLQHFLEANSRYFLHSVHPDTGLVLDRSSFSDLATVAGTGFGLTIWPMLAQVGQISHDQAFTLVQRALTTLATEPMGGTEPGDLPVSLAGQIGVNGYLYHFLDSRTGARAVQTNQFGVVTNGSELSPVDTALCFLGVMTCQQAMRQTNGYSSAQEATIQELANTILSRVRWPFLMRTNAEPHQCYLAWKPEAHADYVEPLPSGVGFVASANLPGGLRIYTWDYTTDEILLIALAGVASPAPANRWPTSILESWTRQPGTFAGYRLLQSVPGAAFTYQFANLWLPMRTLPPDVGGTDWWLNSWKAMQANYLFCTDVHVRSAFDTFDGISFGLTACEDPSGRYRAFGAPPALECDGLSDTDVIACFLQDVTNEVNHVNGTLAPYGAASAIDFLPREAIAALRHYYFDLGLADNHLGLPDAFNMNVAQLANAEGELDAKTRTYLQQQVGPWRQAVQFSIDQGPLVIALANYLHGGIIQKWLVSHPDMQRALGTAFPSSGLSFSATVGLIPSGKALLTWPAVGTNGHYTVEFRNSLSTGVWTPVAPVEQWPTTSRAWEGSVIQLEQRFYRVRTQDFPE